MIIGMCHARAFPVVMCPMPTSRRPPLAASRTAKPESIRAAHQQISRNDGTLADIAALIELEGKAHPSRSKPAQPLRFKAEVDSAETDQFPDMVIQHQTKGATQHPLFGIPLPAVLTCVLIVGAALGVPVGVLTYGTAVYTAVMEGLAVF